VLQGATLQEKLVWSEKDSGQPVDLSGYTARMQAREYADSASAFIDLTTENGGITLGGASGSIDIAMTATATAALTPIKGVYDLELISGSGIVYRIVQGELCVIAEVTQ
jgi:hypothetical protein